MEEAETADGRPIFVTLSLQHIEMDTLLATRERETTQPHGMDRVGERERERERDKEMDGTPSLNRERKRRESRLYPIATA